MTHDPLAAAITRAAEIKDQLLEEAGGSWSSAEVAQHLDITLQAVDQRRRRGTLIAVEVGDSHRFPLCQFTEMGTPDGLSELLQAIDSESEWVRLSLLLSPTLRRGSGVPDDEDEQLSVIEALKRGRRDEALHAVRTWGRQGGD